jgi:hypothetical protein
MPDDKQEGPHLCALSSGIAGIGFFVRSVCTPGEGYPGAQQATLRRAKVILETDAEAARAAGRKQLHLNLNLTN